MLNFVLKDSEIFWVVKLRQKMPSKVTDLWWHEYYWGMRMERQVRVGLWRILHTKQRTSSAWVTILTPWCPSLESQLCPLNNWALDFFLPRLLYLLTSLGLDWSSWSLSLACLKLSTFCSLSAWSSWMWAGHLGIIGSEKSHAWQLGKFFPYGKILWLWNFIVLLHKELARSFSVPISLLIWVIFLSLIRQ